MVYTTHWIGLWRSLFHLASTIAISSLSRPASCYSQPFG
jgi:hypothetical protein